MYALEQAIARATFLKLSIYTMKAFNKMGRRVFLVNSASDASKKHCVTHTPSGLICDCHSFKKNQMCSCIGCVTLFLRTLTVKERTAILLPRGVKKPVEKTKVQAQVEAILVKAERVNATTTIGANIEKNIPAIFMR